MYFSKIVLRYDRLELGQLAQLNLRHDGPHHIIWRAFDGLVPNDERPCLYRADADDHGITFHVVSAMAPLDWDGRFEVQTKAYNPKLPQGATLGFMLRANATVARKASDKKRSSRHDIVIDYKKNDPNAQGLTRPEIAQLAGEQWLKQRGEARGFGVLDVRVDGYQQQRFYKRSKGSKPVEFSTLEFAGRLQVTEPELFLQTLYQGLGSTKAYGNGLLMVRPL